MSPAKRRTKVQSVALNEYLLGGATELVEAGKFSSISDVITTALTEFLVKYEAKEVGKTEVSGSAEVILKALLQSEEGKELLASLCRVESPKPEPVKAKKPKATREIILE